MAQCYKYGVKSVTCSWRTAPMGFHWPENFNTVPLLQRVEGRTCHFKDGSTADVDAIILCTGYKHHFPFMAPELRLDTTNRSPIGSCEARARLPKECAWREPRAELTGHDRKRQRGVQLQTDRATPLTEHLRARPPQACP